MSEGMFSRLIDPQTAKPPAAATVPTPPRSPPPAPPVASKKRKQISAYLSPAQLHLLKQLHFQFNSGDTTVEKSEIIGLSLEVFAELLRTQVLPYASIQQLRHEIQSKISKYLSTQGPNHSST
jgi:hypothetical protein